MSLEVQQDAGAVTLRLAGEWGAREFGTLEQDFAGVDLHGARSVLIDAGGLKSLDLSGAWALHEFVRRTRAAGVEVSFQGSPPDQLRLLDDTLKESDAAPPPPSTDAAAAPAGPIARLLRRIGHDTFILRDGSLASFTFLGRTTLSGLGSFTRRKRLRPVSIARHVFDTGVTALPIVALIAFLISVIIAYMSATQLRGLGADIYVVDLVTIGVLRELGVLLTSIIVAGRSGSAFAAELGTMKLNQEVDALIATGLDPFEVLVVPRVAGLVIALPLLTIVADLVGIGGGAVLCRLLLDMPLNQYLGRANEAISPTTFWVGIIKAPVFAMLIGIAGCYRGMQVRDSARELGRLVTVAVVQAIVLVILADALFAVLFMRMDI
ncbi:MAG TPA: ABC transporter permease [Steroidobacteraceae bacterium]|jgi:phospholipid/cholesterol/gamma-HCH transport system permease protein